MHKGYTEIALFSTTKIVLFTDTKNSTIFILPNSELVGMKNR